MRRHKHRTKLQKSSKLKRRSKGGQSNKATSNNVSTETLSDPLSVQKQRHQKHLEACLAKKQKPKAESKRSEPKPSKLVLRILNKTPQRRTLSERKRVLAWEKRKHLTRFI